MCIAVIKNKGVEMPTKDELESCFTSNPHGAGFCYNRNGITRIVKGLMTFDAFYKELIGHNLTKEDVVFLHFRIATHGLRDGGNTHPFPITESIDEMRKIDNEYKGFCFIHNGVFHYSNELTKEHDKKDIISDTMLFGKIVAEEIRRVSTFDFESNEIEKEKALALELKFPLLRGEKVLDDAIEKGISFSKVAVMDENGEVMKFGNWIESNGVFYSNYGFSGYGKYQTYQSGSTKYITRGKYLGHNDLFGDCEDENYQYHGSRNSRRHMMRKKKKMCCDYCGKYTRRYSYLNDFVACYQCQEDLISQKCAGCGESFLVEEMASSTLCYDCFYKKEPVGKDVCICVGCGQNYKKEDESPEPQLCDNCFQQVFAQN